jgi:alpha-D-ribose 1-methylphosphonate 5-triphosphate synthase subunit PhnL
MHRDGTDRPGRASKARMNCSSRFWIDSLRAVAYWLLSSERVALVILREHVMRLNSSKALRSLAPAQLAGGEQLRASLGKFPGGAAPRA